jgi:dihydroorotate dehydrogenase electron transfer subunit
MDFSPRDQTPRCAATGRVLRITPLCREHVCVEAAVEGFPDSDPGQFIQILCHDPQPAAPTLHEWPDGGFPSVGDPDFAGRQPFLRRPYSIADQWRAADGTMHVCVISRAVGIGSRWLETLRTGDTLDITGPLGRGFRIPRTDTHLLLIGGGVGIPPLLYLARRLHEQGRNAVTAIFGALTRELFPVRLTDEPRADGTPTRCVALPGGAPYPAIVTTDDGTLGVQGRTTDGLRKWLSEAGADARGATVLACGPDAMLKALAKMTRALEMDCQLCIERNMGCGIGTCLSCVVRVRDAGRPEGWRWALTCTDGPVFARDILLDYAEPAKA